MIVACLSKQSSPRPDIRLSSPICITFRMLGWFPQNHVHTRILLYIGYTINSRPGASDYITEGTWATEVLYPVSSITAQRLGV